MTLRLRDDDQVPRLAFYMQQKKCMDLSDPGTGKTPPVCVNMGRRVADGIKTAWVQPLALIEKNIQEVIRWTGLPRSAIAVLDGSAAKIQKEMTKGAQIFMLGPDRLKTTYQGIWEQGVRALDTDEHHMCFGGPESARTEVFLEMAKYMDEMVMMTGTMINGRLDTGYSAIAAIEPRYYPFGYELSFLSEHAQLDDYGRPIFWSGHEKLSSIFGTHGIRYTFEQIFGKQAVIPEVQWVSMHPAQLKMFEQLRKDAFLELEDFFVDGSQPGPAMIRARQLMEHPNAFPDLRDLDHKLGLPPVDIMPNKLPGKVEALKIHFEDHVRTGKPLIMFAALIPQQRQILEVARESGLRAALMNGSMSRAQKNRVDEAFRAGELDAVIATPGVASVGFNWQYWGPKRIEVDHVINVSLGYMDSDFIQGYRRTVREKRQTPLRITTLAYYESLDPRFMQILETKSLDAWRVDPTREVLRFNHYQQMHEQSSTI
jgi:hypothetical protein